MKWKRKMYEYNDNYQSYDDLEYNRNYIEENKNPIKCDYSA